MNVLKLELNRAFVNRNMLISLFIGIILSLADIFLFSKYYLSQDMVLVQAWIGTNYFFVYNSIFFALLPILACLPFGGSLFNDIESGYDKNICIKVSRMDYISSKCIATFLSGFFAVSVPLLLDMFIVAGLFPNKQPELLCFMVGGATLDCNLFSEVFAYNASLYCLVYILTDGLFAGAIALISLAVTKLSGSFFTVVVVPFVLYIFQGLVMIGDSNGNWSVLGMINPTQQVVTRWYQMLIAYCVILIGSLIVSILYNRKRDIL